MKNRIPLPFTLFATIFFSLSENLTLNSSSSKILSGQATF